MLIAGTALFVSLGGSAVAAERLIRGADIAPNAVTSAKIKDGSVTLVDLQPRTAASLRGGAGTNGINGANGPTGAAGTTASAVRMAPTVRPELGHERPRRYEWLQRCDRSGRPERRGRHGRHRRGRNGAR